MIQVVLSVLFYLPLVHCRLLLPLQGVGGLGYEPSGNLTPIPAPQLFRLSTPSILYGI